MLNPNEDTEWNDILRQKGILPPKKVEPIEEPPSPPDQMTVLNKLTMNQLEEKIDVEIDEEDARFLEEYRRKRIASLKEEALRARFGCVREVSKSDWATEVTSAGNIYVIIHIAEKGHPLCTLVDQIFKELAAKFPKVKFLRGEACLCIPDFPQCNLPSILIYKSGDLVHQFIGPKSISGSAVTAKSLEWRLAQINVLETKLTEDPSKRIQIKTTQSKWVNRVGHHSLDNADSDSS